MGFKDSLRKIVPGKEPGAGDKREKIEYVDAKYPNETCALCGATGCEKKWAGQYWHKKCMRTMRKSAKGMV